jgi:hypothetical protein
MKIDWAQVRTAVERGLHAAEAGEKGSLRVHCGSAEHMLERAGDAKTKELHDLVHKAKSQLDPTKAVDILKKALELCPTPTT